jgi:hypothetical protein
VRGNTIAGFQSEPKLTGRSRSEYNATVDPSGPPVKGKFGIGKGNLTAESRAGRAARGALTPTGRDRNVGDD